MFRKFNLRLSVLLLIGAIIVSSFAGCNVLPEHETPQISVSTIQIINGGRVKLEVGTSLQLKLDLPSELHDEVVWTASNGSVTVDSTGLVTAVEVGNAAVTAKWNDLDDTAMIEVIEKNETSHDDVKDDFYENYTPATSYEEAIERSKKGILSGSIDVPDQAPILAEYQPRIDGLLVRNSEPIYADANTYVVVDEYGDEVMRIYRGGGYITIEEVAAYVYAFGDVPANYVSGKKTEPENSIWGEYLRLNHTKFSGNTRKYPYEPKLPRISGCGGDLYYYEIDIGTTGTDCDPGYAIRTYNDGKTITRGAARIIYTRYDANKNQIIDPNEKFVFYTYNHYNDFQEYLNYFGGWGEMFGNITGGGTLSSKHDYAPTPYVPVVMAPLSHDSLPSAPTLYAWVDKRALECLIAA